MSQTVNERVSEVIEKALDRTNFTVTSLSRALNVSRNTIYRWRDKKNENFEEEHLEELSKVLELNLHWLKTGRGPSSNDEKINEIERRVVEKGEDYKGLDQTLSDVESKARDLKQDLESLLEDLDKLRSQD